MVNKKKLALFIIYIAFIIASLVFSYDPGIQIGKNFYIFALDMIKVLPFAFVLIGLFEVWVKRETIEKHLGESSGIEGYIWAILLSTTTVGGIFTTLPLAHALYKKGARLNVVITYLGAASVCRIPMTVFEISFIGLKFSIIRWLVSLPLVILIAIFIEKVFKNKYLGIPDDIE
ncbi:permease [Clostridiaceae bacterium M8S5]|nr:permease [Clostridiaceae bacterium M8S5]